MKSKLQLLALLLALLANASLAMGPVIRETPTLACSISLGVGIAGMVAATTLMIAGWWR